MAYSKTSNKTQDKDVRYLNKDFNTFKQQLVEFTKVYYPNTFNDFSVIFYPYHLNTPSVVQVSDGLL